MPPAFLHKSESEETPETITPTENRLDGREGDAQERLGEDVVEVALRRNPHQSNDAMTDKLANVQVTDGNVPGDLREHNLLLK